MIIADNRFKNFVEEKLQDSPFRQVTRLYYHRAAGLVSRRPAAWLWPYFAVEIVDLSGKDTVIFDQGAMRYLLNRLVQMSSLFSEPKM